MDENEASFDCNRAIKDPESADWYVCGGPPERHGADFRECPQPTSGFEGNEKEPISALIIHIAFGHCTECDGKSGVLDRE